MIRVGLIGDGPAARAFEPLCDVVRGEPAAVIEAADAVVVCSDAELRFHHVALALEADRDVLVEQPVAPTVENARMLERIASLRPTRPVVQASQSDHFNPALRRLAELLTGLEPAAVECRRQNAGPAGMLQDVHTLVSLARSPLVRLQAWGTPDYSVATLVFESGLIGTIAGGHAGPVPVHEVRVTTLDASIAVDALTGEIEVARKEVCERSKVEVGDTCVAEAESFLTAVRERGRPAVGLRTATACLEVAESVRECLAVQAAATGTGGVPAR